MFEYPPFGFSVWYDRHTGRRWCWAERSPTEIDRRFQQAGEIVPVEEDDVTDGWNHRSRPHAIRSVREELRRRGEREERRREALGAATEQADEIELEVDEDDADER